MSININTDLATIKTKYDEVQAELGKLATELTDEGIELIHRLHLALSKPIPTQDGSGSGPIPNEITPAPAVAETTATPSA